MATLEECVADFLKSQDVQDAARAKLNKGKKLSFSETNDLMQTKARAIRRELIEILREQINGCDDFILSARAKDVLLRAISATIYYDPEDGQWTVDVYFARDMVTRRSWLNMGSSTPEGAIDPRDPNYDFDVYLPLLFERGYKAQRHVFLHFYDGSSSRMSKMTRAGGYFLGRTVTEFNWRHKDDGTHVFLNDIYYMERSRWRAANDWLLR